MRYTTVGLCLLLLAGNEAFATTPPPSTQGSSAARAPQSAQVLHDVIKGLLAMAATPRNPADDVQMRTLLKAVLDDPAFPSLASADRHAASVMYGATLVDANEFSAALDVLRPASEMPEAVSVDWELRFSAAYRTANYEDAARSLTMLAQHWPKSLANVSPQNIAAVGRELGKKPEDAKLHQDLLAALTAAGWQGAI